MYEHLNKVVSVVKKSIAHRPLFTINFTVYKGIQSNHMFLCTHRELLNHLLLRGTVHVRLHKIIGWTYNLIQDMLMPKHPEIVEEASSLI